LALSLEGLRDFSVIATAPQKRLSIKTFVNRLSMGIVREAVLRELKRGGQAYYLYNEVETIQNRREELEQLLPEARIAVAQGEEPDLGGPINVATEVNLHAPALLPESYCGDVHERLVLYKRVANCASEEVLERLIEELVDRFGPLPDPARVLIECHKLRIQG